ncbi:hypothetical protein OG292_01345 [Streptomyces sp. NBC_01511]|uniref:hypothetical protein n=1 Tax=Streptomyces sp. NBC_01511 TaxID=2903889 RepID=UPI00386462B2
MPPERLATLLARRERQALYRFDLRLQGEDETIFLDFPYERAPYEPRPSGVSAAEPLGTEAGQIQR